MHATRQVIAVFRPSRHSNDRVEINNGSDGVITSVYIQLRAKTDDGKSVEQIMWRWADDNNAALPTLSYLRPGETRALMGNFWPADRNSQPLTEGGSIQVAQADTRISVAWQDSYGDVWFRAGNESVFPTTWAYPGRDIRGPVPREYWPDHWPGADRPISMAQRVRRARYLRQQRRRPFWEDENAVG
jgi:hypothetical protein